MFEKHLTFVRSNSFKYLVRYFVSKFQRITEPIVFAAYCNSIHAWMGGYLEQNRSSLEMPKVCCIWIWMLSMAFVWMNNWMIGELLFIHRPLKCDNSLRSIFGNNVHGEGCSHCQESFTNMQSTIDCLSILTWIWVAFSPQDCSKCSLVNWRRLFTKCLEVTELITAKLRGAFLHKSP